MQEVCAALCMHYVDHLSSMDTLTSVDDRPYWRDANEGGRNIEPLHCKAHLQLWHKDVADSAMACHVHVTTAFNLNLSATIFKPPAV